MVRCHYRGVSQLVDCVIWDHDAMGSSPVTPRAKRCGVSPSAGYFARCSVIGSSAYPRVCRAWLVGSTLGSKPL